MALSGGRNSARARAAATAAESLFGRRGSRSSFRPASVNFVFTDDPPTRGVLPAGTLTAWMREPCQWCGARSRGVLNPLHDTPVGSAGVHGALRSMEPTRSGRRALPIRSPVVGVAFEAAPRACAAPTGLQEGDTPTAGTRPPARHRASVPPPSDSLVRLGPRLLVPPTSGPSNGRQTHDIWAPSPTHHVRTVGARLPWATQGSHQSMRVQVEGILVQVRT